MYVELELEMDEGNEHGIERGKILGKISRVSNPLRANEHLTYLSEWTNDGAQRNTKRNERMMIAKSCTNSHHILDGKCSSKLAFYIFSLSLSLSLSLLLTYNSLTSSVG